MPAQPDDGAPPGIGRFGARGLLGLLALTAGGVPFLLLMLLVQQRWSPLESLDAGTAARLNEWANSSPLVLAVMRVVTDLGGNEAAVLIFLLALVFAWIRHQRRLAAYVAVTGIGLAVLVPLTKVLIGRARPVVDLPVARYPATPASRAGTQR